jgi:hypothetical protein
MKLTSKDPAVLAEMKALVEAYRGPITYCPPGEARGHEVKVSYGYDPPRPQKPARQNAPSRPVTPLTK